MSLQLPVSNFCMLASPSRESIKVTLDYLIHRFPLSCSPSSHPPLPPPVTRRK